MYKKSWCTCKVVVLLINLLFFWRSRYRPRCWILKSLISQSPQMNALTSSILIFYNEPKNVQLSTLLFNTLHFITNSVLSPLTNTFSKTFVFMWGETPLKATWPYYSVSVPLSTVHTKPSGNTFSFPRSSRPCALLSCPWTPASFQDLHLYPSTWKRYLGFN